MSSELLSSLEQVTHGDLLPGLTFLFDLPVSVSLERLSKTGKNPDKFESMGEDFFRRVRQAYHERAKANPRIKIIDSNRPIEQVAADVLETISSHLQRNALIPAEPAAASRSSRIRLG